jgi:hypothetical protein
MADRIYEIKSLLERVSSYMVAELEAQREEIQILKEKVIALEKMVAQKPEVVVVQHPVAEEPSHAPEPEVTVPEQVAAPEAVLQQEDTPRPLSVSEPVASPAPVSAPEPIAAPRPYTPAAPVIVSDPDPDPEETFFTVTDLNEVHAAPKTMVADLFAERNTIADVAQSKTIPWMVDIPGPKVEMIQSALTFNDRLTFIRELFDGDSEQFNITLDRINETTTFDEVVSDMRDAYPEWDESSPIVYRFYMEVRRKFRN